MHFHASLQLQYEDLQEHRNKVSYETSQHVLWYYVIFMWFLANENVNFSLLE